jgi:hypothetical protein
MCPLVPGKKGSWKFTIWAAKTNAPSTPIRGNFSGDSEFLIFLHIIPTPEAARAAVPAATGRDNNSLAMCIFNNPRSWMLN